MQPELLQLITQHLSSKEIFSETKNEI